MITSVSDFFKAPEVPHPAHSDRPRPQGSERYGPEAPRDQMTLRDHCARQVLCAIQVHEQLKTRSAEHVVQQFDSAACVFFS